MRIKYVIYTDTLGDTSSAEQSRYATVVESAIHAEYPSADVEVVLDDKTCGVGDGAWVDGDPLGDDADCVNEIGRRVWENAEYV